jgi:dihydrolipoamide dehydrogenase
MSVAVIGAGPGGYTAAFLAADLGMCVTLINLAPLPGGVCLHRGCIPSKALLHVAKLINESRLAKNWGVDCNPTVDVNRLRAFKDGVIKKLSGGLAQLGKMRQVEYLQGCAAFENSNTLRITVEGGASQRRTFDRVIIATGSRPVSVPSLNIASPRVVDSTGALALADIPASMLVVGGGYIGLELATVYAALGTRITVVEMTSGLLPGADRDLVVPLHKRMEKMASILLNTGITGLVEEANGIRVTFDGPNLKEREKVFDKVLVSIGRKPNSEVEGLGSTSVVLTPRGFIQVNNHAQTDDPAIYAVGDVAGDPMLAHKAAAQARIAVEHIAGHDVSFAPKAIPAVVFTDPEIAWCGLTETQSQKEGREITVSTFPWAASGRALTLDRTEGMTKLIVDPATKRILGMGITGPDAGEMIAEGVLAIEMGAVVTDLMKTIHPHPTLSETTMEAAELFFGLSSHYYRPKTAKGAAG